MKVKELIEKLKEIDENLEVIVQKDYEGNDYSPLDNIWEGYYVPDSTYSGEGYDEDDFEVDDDDGYNYIKEKGKKAVFLSPTN